MHCVLPASPVCISATSSRATAASSILQFWAAEKGTVRACRQTECEAVAPPCSAQRLVAEPESQKTNAQRTARSPTQGRLLQQPPLRRPAARWLGGLEVHRACVRVRRRGVRRSGASSQRAAAHRGHGATHDRAAATAGRLRKPFGSTSEKRYTSRILEISCDEKRYFGKLPMHEQIH